MKVGLVPVLILILLIVACRPAVPPQPVSMYSPPNVLPQVQIPPVPASSDKTAPILTDVVTNQISVGGEKFIELNFKASDDLSGFKQAFVSWNAPNGTKVTWSVDENFSGLPIKIPMIPCKKIDGVTIQLYDAARNMRIEGVKLFELDWSKDTTPPTIKNVVITPRKLTKPGNVTVNLDIEDDMTCLSSANILLETPLTITPYGPKENREHYNEVAWVIGGTIKDDRFAKLPLTIEIPPSADIGMHHIDVIVRDQVNNEKRYEGEKDFDGTFEVD
jgi:hypothetical protein